ncbi:hypothetical protein DWQ65_01445 [Treponema phagedenis]|nr:hypothetical protein DWQ65_01445 [Treponema phagedenis]
MSDVGKCYDNARMESFFATLKKELLYRIDTTKMTREQVKTLVWQYTMVYYNRKRISTVNEDGLPPTFYRLKVTKKRWSGLNIHLGDKNTELILTFPKPSEKGGFVNNTAPALPGQLSKKISLP